MQNTRASLKKYHFTKFCVAVLIPTENICFSRCKRWSKTSEMHEANTRVNTFQDVRERARRARDWIAWKRDFEQTQQELEQILGFSLFTLLLWFVTHGVLLFTDEILYDKFFLKAFLKAINLFVNLKMDEMTLEKFRLWNTAALKVYLSVREKSIEGSFDELASR